MDDFHSTNYHVKFFDEYSRFLADFLLQMLRLDAVEACMRSVHKITKNEGWLLVCTDTKESSLSMKFH